MKGSPPSKRQTFWPAERSSRTRLRTLTISENPTPENRRAGTGNLSSFKAASDDLPAAGAHQEVEDHSEDRQEDDQQRPQDLVRRVRAALEEGNQGNDVEDQDDQADE